MITIATVQSSIGSSAAVNGAHIRALMGRAAAGGAKIAHFPEGALSGYAGQEVWEWQAVDWNAIQTELDAIAVLAAELGCNHRLARRTVRTTASG